MKARQRDDRVRHEHLKHRHCLYVGADVGRKLVGRLDRTGIIARFGLRGGKHVDVVVVVHQRVDAACAASLDVVAVGDYRQLIALYSLLMVAGEQVDVRRHMNQVAGIRSKAHQSVGSRCAAFRVWRCLDGVNVIVIRPGVIGVPPEDTLKDLDDLKSPVCRSAVQCPKLPRTQIHHAFGVERCGVEVIRIVLYKFSHRRLVSGGQRCRRRIRIGRISF